MSPHSRLLSAAILLMLALPAAGAAGWSTDFEAARKEAAAGKENLPIDFTGSDWCSWCIRLRKEVFDQPAFLPGVEGKFTLVELDYPQDKTKLAPSLLEQNARLLEKYPIKGYPTILLCDADGKPFAATGYQPGGPDAYLPLLEKQLSNKSARDQAFTDAAAATGPEKARLLIAALDTLGLGSDMIRINYPEVIASILEADPADETGFQKKEAVDSRFAKFMKDLGELRSKQDLDGVEKLVEGTLKDPLVQGETRQQVHGHHAGTLASAGKKDEAIEVLKKAIAEDPAGARTKELQDFIGLLEREKAGLPPSPPQNGK